MKAKLGLYFYCPRGFNWAVYCYDHVTATGASATKITSFDTKKEASAYVYQMNGWNK